MLEWPVRPASCTTVLVFHLARKIHVLISFAPSFTRRYREEIKKTGRTVPKIGEFGKECAAKWNSMNEEDKKPFVAVANKDRERYKKEMEIYKPARDVNKPKRPGTAFMLFMVDFRKEVAGKEPEGGVAALAKLGGERWRNMADEQKKPYVEKQNECKIKYELAMEEYRKMVSHTFFCSPLSFFPSLHHQPQLFQHLHHQFGGCLSFVIRGFAFSSS